MFQYVSSKLFFAPFEIVTQFLLLFKLSHLYFIYFHLKANLPIKTDNSNCMKGRRKEILELTLFLQTLELKTIHIVKQTLNDNIVCTFF